MQPAVGVVAAAPRWRSSPTCAPASPGSAEERDSGDGAVAFVCAPDGAVAELVGRGAASDEFLDRWRVPGEADSHVWEERFGEELYLPLAREAFAAALKDAGLAEGDIDHAIVTGLHARAVRAADVGPGRARGRPRPGPDRVGGQPRGGAGRRRAVRRPRARRAGAGHRACCRWPTAPTRSILRTTDALGAARRDRAEAGVPSVAEQVAAGRDDLSYATFLTWRGQLRREPPRRPDPERPGAPTVHRSEAWKYGFVASRCAVCGFRHMPPTRVCLSCHAIDQMQPERLADVPGTVATFTIDHLAFSLSPPVVGVIVDFDGGGRYRCEMTDVVASELAIGDRVDDDVPARVDGPGRAQLLLEGPSGGRDPSRGARRVGAMASSGIRDQVAIVGMGCTPLRRAVGQGRRRSLDRRRHRGGGVGRGWRSTTSTPSGSAP